MTDQKFFILENVRISFPDLFSPAVVDGKEGSFGATFLLDKKSNIDVINEIEKHIEFLIKTELKGGKVPADRRCLKDSDLVSRDEYPNDCMVLGARSQTQPRVLKPNSHDDAKDMSESKVYSGCHVDAKISLWAQNNQWGKRINAQLITVRYRGEGEAFTSGHVDRETAVDGFEIDDSGDIFDEAA